MRLSAHALIGGSFLSLLLVCAFLFIYFSYDTSKTLVGNYNQNLIEVFPKAGAVLTDGEIVQISASFNLDGLQLEMTNGTKLENVKYEYVLTVNSHQFDPFTFELIGDIGAITGRAMMTWFVSVTGASVTITFKIVGIGYPSNTHYTIAQLIQKHYVTCNPNTSAFILIIKRIFKSCLIDVPLESDL